MCDPVLKKLMGFKCNYLTKDGYCLSGNRIYSKIAARKTDVLEVNPQSKCIRIVYLMLLIAHSYHA